MKIGSGIGNLFPLMPPRQGFPKRARQLLPPLDLLKPTAILLLAICNIKKPHLRILQ